MVDRWVVCLQRDGALLYAVPKTAQWQQFVCIYSDHPHRFSSRAFQDQQPSKPTTNQPSPDNLRTSGRKAARMVISRESRTCDTTCCDCAHSHRLSDTTYPGTFERDVVISREEPRGAHGQVIYGWHLRSGQRIRSNRGNADPCHHTPVFSSAVSVVAWQAKWSVKGDRVCVDEA